MNISRLRIGLISSFRLLVVTATIALPACGDPDTGTIKAPSRESMQPGASGGDTSKATKKLPPTAEPKTIGPGAKKF